MTQDPSRPAPGAGDVLLGIDVGTGSARAGLFDRAGRMLASAKCDIAIWRAPGAMVEQSSRDIWQAVCRATRTALAEAGLPPEAVGGVGFDATCSLVVVGEGGAPLPVGPSEDPERNIIVWMDHRAVAQAERINAQGHEVLRYVGGRISPEMETPKLLWLAEHRPDIFARAWQFFDLADYLGWRATGIWRARPAPSPANGPISRMSTAGTRAISGRWGSGCWRTRASRGSAPGWWSPARRWAKG